MQDVSYDILDRKVIFWTKKVENVIGPSYIFYRKIIGL